MKTLLSLLVVSAMAGKLAIALLLALYRQKTVSIYKWSALGLDMKPLEFRVFKVGNRPLVDIDIWLHCLRGDINLVGPKPLTVAESARLDKFQKGRFLVKPGIVTPYEVRKKSGIAHRSEAEISAEFSQQCTSKTRFQVLMVAALQWLFGTKRSASMVPSTFNLFGVSMVNVEMSSAIDKIMVKIETHVPKQKTARVAFVNADCVNKYCADKDYKDSLNGADYVFADGIGVKLAARFHGASLLGNVNGTDMFPLLCERLSAGKKKVFLFGGKQEVVHRAAERMMEEYPGVEVVGILNGYTTLTDAEICDSINRTGAELVLIAMGAPLQEVWMQRNSNKLTSAVTMGVGGLFDFYSGKVSRAPVWLRELSLEWVWRLAMQPKDKAYRYLVGNPMFLFRLARSLGKSTCVSNTLEVQL